MRRRVTQSMIIALELPRDLRQLICLPPPQSVLANSGGPSLLRVTHQFAGMWFTLLDDATEIPGRITIQSENGKSTVVTNREEIRLLALKSACFYYDYAAQKLIRAGWSQPGSLPGIPNFVRLASKRGLPKSSSWVGAFTYLYLVSLYAISEIDAVRESDAGNAFPEVLEAGVHAMLYAHFLVFFHPPRALGDPESTKSSLVREMTRRLLDFTAWQYFEIKRRAARVASEPYLPGFLSRMKLRELVLLAARDDSMLQKYGKKRVETLFEQQLSLVLQSFGLFVIPSRRAERTVDLVCISNDPQTRASFLVEAKSSTHAYSLPVADERALREYVRDVKRTLTTLPELRFVLIVGDRPGKSLAQRIANLESELGLPVRFCGARLIAAIRDALPGPISIGVLADHIVRGGKIVDSALAQTLVKHYERAQEAHTSLVRALMSREPLPTRPVRKGAR